MRRIFLGCFPFSSFLSRHDACRDLHFPLTLHYSSVFLFQVLFLICRRFPVFLPRSAPSSLPGSWTISSCPRASSSSSGRCPARDSPEHPGGPRASRGIPSGEGGSADPTPKETAPGGNGSQNITALGYPRGAEISRKKGEGGGGQGCSAEMFVRLLAQTPVWASPAGASMVLGGNCLSSLAHLRTCSSAPRRRGRCSRPWGDNAGRAKPCRNNSQERIPSLFWCLLPWVGASSGL